MANAQRLVHLFDCFQNQKILITYSETHLAYLLKHRATQAKKTLYLGRVRAAGLYFYQAPLSLLFFFSFFPSKCQCLRSPCVMHVHFQLVSFSKIDSGDCTTVATQPRQLHYSKQFVKQRRKGGKKFRVPARNCAGFASFILQSISFFYISVAALIYVLTSQDGLQDTHHSPLFVFVLFLCFLNKSISLSEKL